MTELSISSRYISNSSALLDLNPHLNFFQANLDALPM